MSEPYGFDVQAYRVNQANLAAAAQNLETGKIDQESKQLELNLAKKAMQTQAEVEAILRQSTDLGQHMADDPAGTMAKIAGIELTHGNVAAAVEILGKSATAREASMKAAKAQTENQIKQGEHIASAMENVRDEHGWYAALAGLAMVYPEDSERFQSLLDLPDEVPNFNYQEMAQKISSAAVTSVEQAKRAMADATTAYQKQHAAESKVRTEDLIPAQAQQARDTAYARRKAGDYIKDSQTTTVTDAQKLIELKYRTTEESRVLAIELDEAADAKLRATPALGRTAALKAAFQEMQDNHKFAGLAPRIARLGASRQSPMELPLEGGKIVPEKLLKNRWYTNRGEPFLYDGKGGFLTPEEVTESLLDEVPEEEEAPDSEEDTY